MLVVLQVLGSGVLPGPQGGWLADPVAALGAVLAGLPVSRALAWLDAVHAMLHPSPFPLLGGGVEWGMISRGCPVS